VIAPHQATGVVRLQIRDQASGRKVTSSAFEASSTLAAVREFAAAEFALAGDPPPVFALTYPPFTTFDQPEQLLATLADLGLSPSATLLVKEVKPSFLAASEGAAGPAEDTSATDSPAAASTAEAQPAAAAAAPGMALCPGGHPLTALQMSEEGWCDKCQEPLPLAGEAFECRTCDFFLCRRCRDEAAISAAAASVP